MAVALSRDADGLRHVLLMGYAERVPCAALVDEIPDRAFVPRGAAVVADLVGGGEG